MSSLYDFSQKLTKLNKEKKYSETLKFFKENKAEFTPEVIGTNKYIVYDVLAALIEINRYDAIFSFLEIHSVSLDPKNFSYLLKKFKDKPSINWTIVNKFCDLVPVELLDTECKTIEVERKGKKKEMELASNKEDWFAIKTKALFETEHYDECFNLSKLALESFEKFHYSNDVWFARRIALSKKHLGNVTDALNELLQVLKRKKEWFIQSEISEIYKEKEDFESAFKYAIDGINNYGDIEFKVGLLYLIGELLLKKEKIDLAFKHFSLSKLLRQQEEWSIPSKLSTSLNQLNKEPIPIEKLSELKSELNKYWNSFKNNSTDNSRNQSNVKLQGKIDRILNQNEKGINGFIIGNNNKSYYFNINSEYNDLSVFTLGSSVEFQILPAQSSDKKEKAIKIRTMSKL